MNDKDFITREEHYSAINKLKLLCGNLVDRCDNFPSLMKESFYALKKIKELEEEVKELKEKLNV